MKQFRSHLKKQDKEKQMKEHNDYIRSCQEAEFRRKEKEDRWYQYYRQFDKNLD